MRRSTFDYPSVAEVAAAYPDPRAAFARGNYELAALLAGEQGDGEIGALAVMMSGGVARGLNKLSVLEARYPETPLYVAFGLWCAGDRSAALAQLDLCRASEQHRRAERLRGWIERDTIAVAVVADGNNARGAPLQPGAPFAVRHIPSPIARMAPEAELRDRLRGCDLLLAYDSVSLSLLKAARQEGVATILTSADFDQTIAELHPVLSRANVVLAGTALEHHLLSGIVGARVAAYPGLPYREARGAVRNGATTRDIDIFCSGICFVPHWPDKARVLYRIAALDDPSLKIVIHDGYIEDAAYRDLMARAKYVPLINRMGFSVHQDRSIEVMHYGANGLAFGGVEAKWLLDGAARYLEPVEVSALETEISERLSGFDPGTDRRADAALIADFFPTPPDRDVRLLKFALFQTLFAERVPPAALPKSEPEVQAARRRTSACFERYMQTPLNADVQADLLAALNAERGLRPNANAPMFNMARVLWLTGARADAVTLFRRIADLPILADAFEPADSMLPHRARALSALMPYQAYYQSIVLDLGARDPDWTRVGAVIHATCLTYLALDASQSSRFADAVRLAGEALALCDRHHPAAVQLTKAAVAGGFAPTDILRGYLAASDLYPPLIDELLPFGVDAMERLGYGDLAESHVRQWLYARVRIVRARPDTPPIPQQTIDYAVRYLDRMPDALKAALASLPSGTIRR